VEINRTQTTPAIAKAKCDRQPLLFHDLGSRKVVADFSDGLLSVDGGALLLRQVDLNLKLSHRVAACFSDYRVQRCVEHSLPELIAQRLNALCLGYQDLNDHNSLRLDLEGSQKSRTTFLGYLKMGIVLVVKPMPQFSSDSPRVLIHYNQ
jgi:hypothetical protein